MDIPVVDALKDGYDGIDVTATTARQFGIVPLVETVHLVSDSLQTCLTIGVTDAYCMQSFPLHER